ncbi:hypothetical protein L7F22_069051 [Adiantum nelumboides]|nr:hypothetical protein [Adiantum nelumboides]
MADDHIRAGFYQAGSDMSLADVDGSLFTHLIFVPSAPLRRDVKLKLHFHNDDLRHAATFARAIPSSCKALLALPFDYNQYRSPVTLASSMALARDHHFRGLHFTLGTIDALFLRFCHDWRQAASQQSRLTCRPLLLLTASFGSWDPPLTVPTGVPLPLDWICLHGYHGGRAATEARPPQPAYHSHYSPVTVSHSPLHDCNPSEGHSIHFRLRTCLDAGVDPSTLVLGLAMHGVCFRLRDPSIHGMHAPVVQSLDGKCADASSAMLKLPQHSGTHVAYKDVTRFIQEHKAKRCHDGTTQSAYCYHGATWICYHDTFTISQRVGYLKSMRLKGYALDSLHHDTSQWHLSNAGN